MNPILWLDDIGRPAWIGLMIVSFVLFPPAGLVVLGYLIGSGRLMGCWTEARGERWQRRVERMQQRMQERAARWCGPRRGGPWGNNAWTAAGSASGNRAFDEYRNETLRRLEEEERQFKEFLDRLRRAKDKAEFDEFMAEMRGRGPEGPMPQPEG
ncbi:MAG TPA: DUF2852 domain-containing protein [Stellaceae bacterium]|nr:DUF2852 domain-containing protein [Stellaceae bacterium]